MDISADAVVSYVDRAVDQMAEIVTGLGDDLANRKPALAGANSPYAILRHCLGVMEFWGGEVVAGRKVIRDRPAEFRSRGPVADLSAAARKALNQFRADAATADFAGPVRGGTGDQRYPGELEFTSQGHALLHVLEEVTQHLGQMELTRDVLHAADSPSSASPGPTTPRSASPGPTTPRSASPGPTAPRSASPGPTAPRSASPGPTAPRSASPDPTTPRSASPDPTTPP